MTTPNSQIFLIEKKFMIETTPMSRDNVIDKIKNNQLKYFIMRQTNNNVICVCEVVTNETQNSTLKEKFVATSIYPIYLCRVFINYNKAGQSDKSSINLNIQNIEDNNKNIEVDKEGMKFYSLKEIYHPLIPVESNINTKKTDSKSQSLPLHAIYSKHKTYVTSIFINGKNRVNVYSTGEGLSEKFFIYARKNDTENSNNDNTIFNNEIFCKYINSRQELTYGKVKIENCDEIILESVNAPTPEQRQIFYSLNSQNQKHNTQGVNDIFKLDKGNILSLKNYVVGKEHKNSIYMVIKNPTGVDKPDWIKLKDCFTNDDPFIISKDNNTIEYTLFAYIGIPSQYIYNHGNITIAPIFVNRNTQSGGKSQKRSKNKKSKSQSKNKKRKIKSLSRNNKKKTKSISKNKTKKSKSKNTKNKRIKTVKK